MDGLEVLRLTYHFLPVAILLDLVALQLALRGAHRLRARRARRRHGSA